MCLYLQRVRGEKKQKDALEERATIKEAFDFIDADGSGTLDSVELRRLLERLRAGQPLERVKLLIAFLWSCADIQH